ncbi:hypothetical protein [Anaerostipes caccae]|uniref:hypothetical protein n=1 Tax=Anaerostipes caccae TaxID=105841 RepID=UPI0038D4BE0D
MRCSTEKIYMLEIQVQNVSSFCTFSVFVNKTKIFDTSKVSMICGGRVNNENDE